MTKTTTVINLYAGAGAGKSTIAADVFTHMKKRGLSVELVREYVKDWAWRGHEVGPYDDVYLFAKQLRSESALYGKVDWIVTDSPLGLGPVYELLHNPSSFILATLARSVRERQQANGLKFVDCLLQRQVPYQQEGRFHSEEQAKQVDRYCHDYLRNDPYWMVRHTEDVLYAAELL